jgi:hypothetical protein
MLHVVSSKPCLYVFQYRLIILFQVWSIRNALSKRASIKLCPRIHRQLPSMVTGLGDSTSKNIISTLEPLTSIPCVSPHIDGHAGGLCAPAQDTLERLL